MVTWVDGAIANPPPASEEAVRAAQLQLRVPFPADFLAIARTHQGARPEPADIDLGNGFTTAVDCLLHFEDSPFVSNILAAGFPVADALDKGVIPFAKDIGGDLFCFSYREDYDHPPVVFWSADWGTLPLAPSFSAFVELLHNG